MRDTSNDTSDELIVVPFEGHAETWDGVVVDTPGGTFCRLAGWRKVMERALGDTALDEANERDVGLRELRFREPMASKLQVSNRSNTVVRDVPLPWLQRAPVATPSPEKGLYPTAPRLWSRLP